MFDFHQKNFSIYTIQKESTSISASKNTYYADFKICLALEGSALWEIEDKTYLIEPNDIVFLNIGQKRQFTSFGKEGFKLCVLSLKRNAFTLPFHFSFFLAKAKENLILKNCKFAPLIKETCCFWNTDFPLKYEFASAKITEFFIKAEKETNFNFVENSEFDEGMSALLDYIDDHITEGVSLSMVAQKANMSESTFSRRFKIINGISFKQYVVAKKLDTAIHLLKTTNKKVIDIAFESGFESVSGFYDAFKKLTGTTPNKFL